MTTILYTDPTWKNDPSTPAPFDYELTDTDRLCFTCPLSDCKENSKKCPINIIKSNTGKRK